MALGKRGEISKIWWGAMLLVFVSLLLLQCYIQWARAAREERLGEGPTAPAVIEKEGLRIEGRADRGKVSPTGEKRRKTGPLSKTREGVSSTDTVQIWIILENRADTDIQDLKLGPFRTPGFRKRRCWMAEVPACRPGETEARASSLPTRLPPGRAVTIMAELQAEGSSGTWVMTGPISWTLLRPQKPAVEAQSTVTIGPLQVTEAPPPRLFVVGDAVYSFFKDLGLPAVLGVLAFLFQRLQQDRGRQHETRQFFLNRVTENAVRFLMPISNAARALRGQSQEFQEATRADAKEVSFRRCFYYFLHLNKKMRDLGHQGGGFFFTVLEAETVVNESWGIFFSAAIEELGYAELSAVLDAFGEQESLTSLEKKVFRPRLPFLLTGSDATAAEQTRKYFRRWLGKGKEEERSFARYHILLDLISKVVLFEVNRMYAPWYEQEDPKERKELEELWCRLERSDHTEVASLLRAYLDKLGKLPKPRVAKPEAPPPDDAPGGRANARGSPPGPGGLPSATNSN